MTGVAQRLSTGLGLTDPTPGLRHISFQADGAGVGLIYIGDENVSATDYAVRIEVPVAVIAGLPYVINSFESGPMRLSDFYILGTAAELLHIGIIEF
jgi:hypothetical protein